VEKVDALGELPAALERALTRPVDSELRRGFLRYVHACFLVHGSYEDFSPRSLAAVAQRILELLPRASAAHSERAKNLNPCPWPSISG
jgi:hypothetical protein